MVLPGFMGTEESAPAASLLMNTSLPYPIALDQGGWEKAGQDTAQFAAMPGAGGLTHSMLPMLRLGAFEIPNIPGVLGAPVADLEKAVRVDLDGFAGSGLFATFRMTFADGGRTLWLEDLPPDVIEARIRAAEAIRRIQSRPIGSSVPMAAPPGGSEGPGGLLPPPPTGSSSGPGGQTDNPMPGAR